MTRQKSDTESFRKENAFLHQVIRELPSLIMIEHDQGNLHYSSCKAYSDGTCKGCNKNVDNFKNKTVIELDNCALNFKVADILFKEIDVNQKKYQLTIVNDISEKDKREKELNKAKRNSEEAIRTREKFLASMSHELRTPIAGMVGLIEILNTKIKNDEASLLLRNVSSSAKQLNLLVNDILDFSKLEAKQLRISPFDCDILRETGEIVRVHSSVAHKKGIKHKLCI